MTRFVQDHRDWALLIMFALLTLESFGLPVPGETALIACSVLASQGSLTLAAVIAVGVTAAIVGDNLGYWAGRKGGRPFLERHERTRRYADRYLSRSERFFERHGGKAVFLGRFVAVLRVTTAWVAGMSRMHWWSFLAWNAAGGLVWATLVCLVSYFLGDAAAGAIGRFGVYAGGGVLVLTVLGFLVVRRVERRVVGDDE